MKQLLLNPNSPSGSGIGLLYILLFYNSVSSNKKIATWIEDAGIFLFLFQIPGLSIEPFPRFHPMGIYNLDKTIPAFSGANCCVRGDSFCIITPTEAKS